MSAYFVVGFFLCVVGGAWCMTELGLSPRSLWLWAMLFCVVFGSMLMGVALGGRS